jgi:hypothetical protein
VFVISGLFILLNILFSAHQVHLNNENKRAFEASSNHFFLKMSFVVSFFKSIQSQEDQPSSISKASYIQALYQFSTTVNIIAEAGIEAQRLVFEANNVTHHHIIVQEKSINHFLLVISLMIFDINVSL